MHLLAVVRPARLHQREKRLDIRCLTKQDLEPALDVPLALASQPVVYRCCQILQTHVLDSTVQLLEAVPHGLLCMHSVHCSTQPSAAAREQRVCV